MSHVRHQRRKYESDNLQGELRKLKLPTFDGENRKGDDVETRLLIIKKYFQLHNYSSDLQANRPHIIYMEKLLCGGINETIRGCPVNLNGENTNVDLSIIPLGSYDILIGMDWLERHYVFLDCQNKTFTCFDEEQK